VPSLRADEEGLRLERGLQLDGDGDLLAEQHAAGLEGRVVVQAEVFTVDDGGSGRAGLVVAVRVLAEATEVEVERDGLGDTLDGEVSVNLEVALFLAVETKSMVGYFSASKKSPVRRWPSRLGSLVLIDSTLACAVTLESRGFSPVTRVPSKRSNVPRTFEIIRWRMLKLTSECVGSMTQVPAL
jgi:hypothetical protein